MINEPIVNKTVSIKRGNITFSIDGDEAECINVNDALDICRDLLKAWGFPIDGDIVMEEPPDYGKE